MKLMTVEVVYYIYDSTWFEQAQKAVTWLLGYVQCVCSSPHRGNFSVSMDINSHCFQEASLKDCTYITASDPTLYFSYWCKCYYFHEIFYLCTYML